MKTTKPAQHIWPELNWNAWKDTAATLHMWTQIVGKTRLALTPPLNHWWNVPLYLSARGLTTSAMPYGTEFLEIEFDFVSHDLRFRISSGSILSVPLRAQSVADFYAEYQRCLAALGVTVAINPVPVEVAEAIPFPQDEVHHTYDPEYAHRFWRVLCSAECLFADFSSGFLGKQSPVHFFWGSFDLAVTRFSGRPAPPRDGADRITREAYSHEVISAGFWPGNGGYGAPAFYCYAAPAPAGLDRASIRPTAAHYDPKLGEFLLKYDDVRSAASPDDAVHQFLQSTYDAGATLAKWDRAALERHSAT
ncbi:DUF5996 family protein [Edaphobacter bradus]|uniref:DUF5996 family protein n=1 Tax=Edaphobacter bradus TaxID=2259016 RepID=UPI0021DFCF3F|nr:DUF5996 family protein [Edaphobacter bradus]